MNSCQTQQPIHEYDTSLARSCIIGSSPVTSMAYGTDKDVLSVLDSREQVFLGNGVAQVMVSIYIHHLKQKKDVIRSIAQLLLDAILSICFICHAGSSRTAGDFIVTQRTFYQPEGTVSAILGGLFNWPNLSPSSWIFGKDLVWSPGWFSPSI